MTFTVEAEIPEGYEMTGELRCPEGGEWFLDSNGRPELTRGFGYNIHRIILRPAPKWRPATVEDAIRALRGNAIPARFRDRPDQRWEESHLRGMVSQSDWPWGSDDENYKVCEVLDV